MSFYKESVIEEIKNKSDIVEVIGEFLPMKKQGRNFLAVCPFHSEKTPSFVISPEKQIYHCFGCNASGNAITFLMEHEQMTFKETIEYLGEKFGVELLQDKSKKQTYKNPNQELTEKLYTIHDFVARYFHVKLSDTIGEYAKKYLINRGISKETCEKFNIGYCPFYTDELVEKLYKLNFLENDLIESGIFLKSQKTNKLYCKFYNRIIFPISDVRGKTIGFGGRIMTSGEPKYINSPETKIFKKKYNLFALKTNLQEIRRREECILTEGYMDVIGLYNKGVLNAVASLGTAFTQEQGKLLLRHAPSIIIAYDSDNAGVKATMRVIETLKRDFTKIKVISLNGAKDPDEFINKFGLNEFLTRLRDSKPVFRYLLDYYKQTGDFVTPEGKVKIVAEIIKYLRELKNTDVDEFLKVEYSNILCSELNFQKSTLDKLISGKSVKDYSKAIKDKKVGKVLTPRYEEDALRIVMNNLEHTNLIDSDFIDSLTSDLIKDIFITIINIPGEIITLDKIIENLDDEKGSYITRVSLDKKNICDKFESRDVIKYLNKVKKKYIDDKLGNIQRRMDENKVKGISNDELLKEWQKYYLLKKNIDN